MCVCDSVCVCLYCVLIHVVCRRDGTSLFESNNVLTQTRTRKSCDCLVRSPDCLVMSLDCLVMSADCLVMSTDYLIISGLLSDCL